MPKPNIVFRAALEEEDSDDEILIIPYTKPAPEVIDLLESESGSESIQEEASKKSPKKKSKKKKSKRDKELEKIGSTDVASLGDQALESSVSSLTVDNVSGLVECLSNKERVEEISCGQVVEPVTLSECADGSKNVATTDVISSIGASNETPSTTAPVQTSLLDNGGIELSSRFEKCLDVQNKCAKGDDSGKKIETGMIMAGATNTPHSENDKQKRVKSRERKINGEGKSRRRTMSATQRTNEEIVNFLTTLGIQMEPSSFETPVTRRRPQKKRPSQFPAPADIETNSRDSSTTTNSNDGQTFPVPLLAEAAATTRAFVSVSQDVSSSSKRGSSVSKGRRPRQAISGDLSDYSISFTNKDLNAINTSFQSNVLAAEDKNRKNTEDAFISFSSGTSKQKPLSCTSTELKVDYLAEVIDAVARGLNSSTSSACLETEKGSTGSAEIEAISQVRSTNFDLIEEGNLETEIVSAANKTGDGKEETVHIVKKSKNDDQNQVSAQKDNQKVNQPSALVAPTIEIETSHSEKAAVQDNPDDLGSRNDVAFAATKAVTSTLMDVDVAVNTAASLTEGTQNAERKSAGVSDDLNTKGGETKRKFSYIEQPEPDSSKSFRGSTTESKGKENADFRQSPERKRHKQNDDDGSLTGMKLKDVRKRGNSKRQLVPENSSSNTFAPLRKRPERTENDSSFVPHESYFPCTWSNKMREFYGSSRDENFELDEVWPSLSDSSDLWSTYKDMMPPPMSKRRHVRCNRCKQFGHLIKECTEKWKPPTCHYCGKVGHTSDSHSRHSRTCPTAMCLNCGLPLSSYAQKCVKCLLQRRPDRCEICNVIGHDKLLCPDSWRRYHSVTSAEDYERTESIVSKARLRPENDRKNVTKNSKVYKRSSTMYCANCGRRGHSYYDCKGNKFNPYPRNKPFVILEAETSEVASTPTASSSVSSIPISYDSRTGRTVSMNTDIGDMPELTVETIQVKITNDLAMKNVEFPNVTLFTGSTPLNHTSRGELRPNVGNKPKGNVFQFPLEKASKTYNCENKKCANKLGPDDKCYQTLMDTKAHWKLARDQHKGILKQLEEKHQVQISVISDGYKIHICGSNALEADQELHSLLWELHSKYIPAASGRFTNLPSAKNSFSQKRGVGSTNARLSSFNVPSGRKAVEVVTVDDEENDCCVVAEIEASGADVSKSTSKDVPEKWKRKLSKSNNGSGSFIIDQYPDKFNAEPELFERKGTEPNHGTAEAQTTCSDDPVKSWLEYESPLAGLSLNFNYDFSRTHVNEHESQAASASDLLASMNNAREQLKTTEKYLNIDSTPVTEAETATFDDSFDLFECDEIDYAEHLPGVQQNVDQPLSEKSKEETDSSESDSDLVVLDPAPSTVSETVEIITIEDDDDEPMPTMHKQTVVQNEEIISLLESEWQLSITELARKNNIINQISEEFKVEIMVSKETSSIIVRKGTPDDLKSAKDEIVIWLESKCLKTDYHLMRRRVDNTGTLDNLKRKKKPRKRVLQLSDVQQQNSHVGHQNLRNKKRKRKPKKKFNNHNHFHNNANFETPSSSSSFQSYSSETSSPVNQSPNFNRRSFKGLKSSSPFIPKGHMHSPTPNKMLFHNNIPKNDKGNNNNAKFPIPSPNNPYFPRTTRYFQNGSV